MVSESYQLEIPPPFPVRDVFGVLVLFPAGDLGVVIDDVVAEELARDLAG